MPHLAVFALSLLLGLATTAPVRADHASIAVGVGTARAMNTESAVPLPRGRWSIGLRSELVEFRAFSDERLLGLRRRRPDGDIHSVDSILALSLGVFHGLTDDLTLGVRLPYVRRDNVREPAAGGPDAAFPAAHATGGVGDRHTGSGGGVLRLGDADGIGDLSLLGHYRVWQRDGLHVALLGGVKTPTGRTSEQTRDFGRFETEFQPGSGSWDGLVGLAGTLARGAVTIDASALYTIATEGAADTDLGDVFTFSAAATRRLFAHDHEEDASGRHAHDDAIPFPLTWDVFLELNGEWRNRESVDGLSKRDSGGTVLYVSPGTRVGIGSHLSVGVSIGVPIAVDLGGDQVTPSYRVVGSAAWTF